MLDLPIGVLLEVMAQNFKALTVYLAVTLAQTGPLKKGLGPRNVKKSMRKHSFDVIDTEKKKKHPNK